MLFRKLYEKPIFILVDTLYISKQNCRIWGSENPNIVLQKPLRPLRVLFGVACEAEALLDYISLRMKHFLCIEVHYVWFQKPSTHCHISQATIDLLCETFDGR